MSAFAMHWRRPGPFDENWNIEPMDAKAEVLLELAIEQMDKITVWLFGHEDLPSLAERRAVCISMCAEVFDRLHPPRSEP
jgi:hypothetical protein